jgi:hypothetical protein
VSLPSDDPAAPADPAAVPPAGPTVPAAGPTSPAAGPTSPAGADVPPGPVPAGAPPGNRFVQPLVLLGLVLVSGLVWGLLWWWIAPTAVTQVIDGGVYLTGHDNLFASQDAWFAIIGAGVGAVLAVVWPPLTRRTPVAGVIAGLVGSAVAGLIAWRIGTWLGPASFKDQLHAGIKAPITPLTLHTPIAVLMAPMIFAAVRIVMELIGHFLDGRQAPEPAPGPWSASQGVHVQQGQ